MSLVTLFFRQRYNNQADKQKQIWTYIKTLAVDWEDLKDIYIYIYLYIYIFILPLDILQKMLIGENRRYNLNQF